MQPQAQQAQQLMPTQLGGAKFQQMLGQWAKESFSVFNVIFFIGFVLFAAYAQLIPDQIRYQASTTLGRVLCVLLVAVVYEYAGWIPALLFTMGVAIMWFPRPLAQPTHMTKPLSTKEGFDGGVKVSKNQTGFRWFVERVLEENPKGVQEDRINFGDVQEDSVEGNTRTSK